MRVRFRTKRRLLNVAYVVCVAGLLGGMVAFIAFTIATLCSALAGDQNWRAYLEVAAWGSATALVSYICGAWQEEVRTRMDKLNVDLRDEEVRSRREDRDRTAEERDKEREKGEREKGRRTNFTNNVTWGL